MVDQYYYTNGGELNLYSSIVYNNKAVWGGGIYAKVLVIRMRL